MSEELDIKGFYEAIVSYEKQNGNDLYCRKSKAKLFSAIGEYEMALTQLMSAYELDKNDLEVIHDLAVVLEKTHDDSLAYAYYAFAAKEYRNRGMEAEYNSIIKIFESVSAEDRAIFDTVLNEKPRTIVFLSICGFGDQKQRYQNMAVAFAQLGNKVIYVSPTVSMELNYDATEDELADYSLNNTTVKEGIILLQPIYSSNYMISNYNAIVRKLSESEEDAVFIISNVYELESVIPIKGKNTIIFDCADDNSDYKNAFWSSPELYAKECELLKYADHVLCTSVTLFLKKHLLDRNKSVYLSNNAVSYSEMKYDKNADIPEDLKNIPSPRIGYIGCVYQRFDRDLFYKLAKDNPDKSFVIIGDVLNNYISPIYNNIYFLGPKSHDILSLYYSNMDICIIPYFDNEKMSMSCDPVKIHEQIFCQVPTITTYMPDTALNRPMVYHANTAEGFQKHIDNILSDKPTIEADELKNYITANSWLTRACAVMRIAGGNINPYETTDAVLKKIQENYSKVKDDHPNFGIVYGISMWNDDKAEAEKYILNALKEYPTVFNKEICERFKEDRNNISLMNTELCTGCMSCVKKCPAGAIILEEDELGFKYPKVNEQLCTHCGLCRKHCHVLSPILTGQGTSYCYAVAADDSIRYESSSGGFFPVIAEYFYNMGGYVAGVVFDKDFSLKHIVSNNIEEIRKMYGSKYSESDMSDVYEDIETLLKKGEKVLFSGCPCQCKALNSYLGRKYENLYTAAVVCHGVPSTKYFKEHIKALTLPGEHIEELSFRKKYMLGWNSGLYIRFSSGREYAEKDTDKFMKSFLSDLSLRSSCYVCSNKSDRYYDINMGDFWGIENIIKDIDSMGYSYITFNNENGRELLANNSTKLKIMNKCKKNQAISYNPSICRAASKPAYRKRFLKNVSEHGFEEAFKKTFTENKFDAVLILWYSNNYGNSLTNYALYTALKKMDKRPLAVDSLMVRPSGQFKRFAEKHFEMSSANFPYDLKYILDCSNNFIVGSDQVWNYEFSLAVGDNGLFQLSFIPDNKNKVSYGSSFGESSKAVLPEKKEFYKKLYKRFDHISTREKFGVKVLKNVFNVNAQYVLDPVFLLDRNDYSELTSSVDIQIEKPFIVTYLLTPSKEKLEYVRKLKDSFGDVEVINIIDAEPARRSINIGFFSPDDNVKTEISPEEFLFYFQNSEYVVTDSYHGACFSIIFEKRFTSFVNRENERFLTFKELGVQNDILSTVPTDIDDSVIDEVDYSKTKEVLQIMKNKSLKYLMDALK